MANWSVIRSKPITEENWMLGYPARARAWQFRGPILVLVLVIWSWLAVIGLLYVITKALNLIGVL